MKKKKSLIIIIVFVLSAVLLLSRVQAANDFFSEIKLIIQVYQIIQNEYIEKVEPSKLIEGAIQGMVEVLNDPLSRWESSEEWEEWNVEKEGKFGGLGMTVGIRDGFVTVIGPLKDTPASRAGLQPGDRILQIDGESTEDMSLDEAVSRLRGETGTEVTISIQREGTPELLEYTLTRALIKLPNVEKKVLEETIGYIRIIGFTNENTSKELVEALVFLKQQGIESLILDVRQNPGGLLSQAVEVANEFLSSGIIVSIKSREPVENNIYSAYPAGEGLNFPLLILIDHRSASASEIVAGAIKDNQRGILLGTRTFGKGTVQNAIPLENGGALWLTTAKYYTPSGKCIDGEGIEPNLEVQPFTPTEEQKEIMDKLRTSSALEDFLDLNPQWETKDLDPLGKELEKENVETSVDLLKRILREKDQNDENDIFNDYQLVQALNLLKSLPTLQTKTAAITETTP